jgi:hypothetical protein
VDQVQATVGREETLGPGKAVICNPYPSRHLERRMLEEKEWEEKTPEERIWEEWAEEEVLHLLPQLEDT